jgi:hypothetical protein
LDVRDEGGALLAQATDFIEVACGVRVNRFGGLLAVFCADDDLVLLVGKRYQVEFWYADDEFGVGWHRFFSGLLLGLRQEYPENGLSTVTVTAAGDLWLLASRIVNWYAGFADRSEFVAEAAETVMKTLVRYNAGADATAVNGRKRNGVISGVTVEADGGGGSVIDWYCHGDNLLESLQGVAAVGGGDFDLVKAADGSGWEFRFCLGQLGTDRRGDVLFAIERGNMVDVGYVVDWVDEKTVAAVWGQNEGPLRAYETVTGPDYAAGNDVEVYVDARDITVDTNLRDRGAAVLDERRAVGEFRFRVVQTPSCVFDRDYFLGDLVRVRNPRTLTDDGYQVDGATLRVSGSDRQVTVELRSI